MSKMDEVYRRYKTVPAIELYSALIKYFRPVLFDTNTPTLKAIAEDEQRAILATVGSRLHQLEGYEQTEEAERLNNLQAQIYVPGEFFCPNCSFTLTKSVLQAATGNVGIDRSAVPEPCPKGCGMMERETWRRAAVTLGKRLEALFDEHQNCLQLTSTEKQ